MTAWTLRHHTLMSSQGPTGSQEAGAVLPPVCQLQLLPSSGMPSAATGHLWGLWMASGAGPAGQTPVFTWMHTHPWAQGRVHLRMLDMPSIHSHRCPHLHVDIHEDPNHKLPRPQTPVAGECRHSLMWAPSAPPPRRMRLPTLHLLL